MSRPGPALPCCCSCPLSKVSFVTMETKSLPPTTYWSGVGAGEKKYHRWLRRTDVTHRVPRCFSQVTLISAVMIKGLFSAARLGSMMHRSRNSSGAATIQQPAVLVDSLRETQVRTRHTSSNRVTTLRYLNKEVFKKKKNYKKIYIKLLRSRSVKVSLLLIC